MDKAKIHASNRDDWQTPERFWLALCSRFGEPEWDMASSDENALCPNYVTAEQDALSMDWPRGPLLYCNPPFSLKTRFIGKMVCESMAGSRILTMLPVDTSTVWFSGLTSVARVLLLTGRVQFEHPEARGNQNSGGNLIAVLDRMASPGITVWDWRSQPFPDTLRP